MLACGAAVIPLLGAIATYTFSKRNRGSGIAIAGSVLTFVLSALVFYTTWDHTAIHRQISWFTIGDLTFTAGVLLNNLSVLMLFLISGISLLVHIYSAAYMKLDPRLPVYWTCLGLFCFSMMALVVADSLLLIYLFWELVGFSSYLLIGFWNTRQAAVLANKKAFIINRIGDIGFLAGIMVLFSQYHTLDLVTLFSDHGLVASSPRIGGVWVGATGQLSQAWLTIAGAVFFFGAMAKSAQFPLHTWLPDAMEGPTPVSSLIHAATMVAAGVFLLVRVFPLFDQTVLLLIASIGTFTAFMAATIALAQHDIKKILAWSTISQLGYMIAAIGMGSPESAMFHLATHAFFKCLLFLSAGAVIHELQHHYAKSGDTTDPQDIRNMGGLRKKMPVTFIVMTIAALALAGFPGTSGFLSKDAVLVSAFGWGAAEQNVFSVIPYLLFVTSLLTAFYVARLIFKVFFGPAGQEELHEAPAPMRWPMIVLALCCLFPLFSVNPVSFESAWIMAGFYLNAVEAGAYHTYVPVLVSLGGTAAVFFAWFCYGRNRSGNIFTDKGMLYRFALNGWYFDKLYLAVFVKPVVLLSRILFGFDKKVVDGLVNAVGSLGLSLSAVSRWTDRYLVDAAVNGLGSISKTIGNFTRNFQNGRVQYYLLATVAGVLLFFMFTYFL
ncbi:NADH-quinone oxidoreductase subunit L [Hufsiella ginkgonis]|uniref:NADH-quinone oxidoreductase subunit L n=1 Tax=Hufsiella ginkgonis TaxID=2695274 RepID=A0A7K1Y3T6_9SPHI|nr:NADH-quinone oxidoreductase subunit L [Hufsiella ginkgonis]MXV17778.1 NADH-quinone oxidoreductase subunit L [Hufsiella ginkgonis]